MADRRIVGMCALGLAGTIAVAWMPPIPQSPSYHQFADTRALLGIANAGNVLSNLAFLLAGAAGLLACARGAFAERVFYAVFFASGVLISAGSAYYHWAPDNARLLWDRLPMTLGFMSLFAGVIAERIDLTWGRRLLIPLLLAGFGSVLYWYDSELRGAGDLRAYALVQFLSLALIVFALAAFPDKYGDGRMLWVGLGWYVVAKVFESYDAAIFAVMGVSGHTLKHLAAALSMGWIAGMIARRRRAMR